MEARKMQNKAAPSIPFDGSAELPNGGQLAEQVEHQKLSPRASPFLPTSGIALLPNQKPFNHTTLSVTPKYGTVESYSLSAELGISRHLLFTSTVDKICPADVDIFLDVSVEI